MQDFSVLLDAEDLEFLGTENPAEVEPVLALLVSVDLGITAGRALHQPPPAFDNNDEAEE